MESVVARNGCGRKNRLTFARWKGPWFLFWQKPWICFAWNLHHTWSGSSQRRDKDKRLGCLKGQRFVLVDLPHWRRESRNIVRVIWKSPVWPWAPCDFHFQTNFSGNWCLLKTARVFFQEILGPWCPPLTSRHVTQFLFLHRLRKLHAWSVAVATHGRPTRHSTTALWTQKRTSHPTSRRTWALEKDS